MTTQLVEFKSDNNILHGKLDILSKGSTCIIFFSGASGKSLTSRFDYLSESLNKAGYNFFRFNFRGQEEGKTIDDSNIEEELSDARNALSYLESEGFNLNNFGIISKSLGNVKTFLLNDQRLKCVGLLAPATFFRTDSNIDRIMNVKYSEIKELSDIVLNEKILEEWKIPTILIHGDIDTTIPVANSEQIFIKISSVKEMKIIIDAKHSLDDDEKQKQAVATSLVNFFRKNLTAHNS